MFDPFDLEEGTTDATFGESIEAHAAVIDDLIGPLVRALDGWRDAKERGSDQLAHPFEVSVLEELDKICPREKKQCT